MGRADGRLKRGGLIYPVVRPKWNRKTPAGGAEEDETDGDACREGGAGGELRGSLGGHIPVCWKWGGGGFMGVGEMGVVVGIK